LIGSEEPATGGCVLSVGLVKEIRELLERVSGLEQAELVGQSASLPDRLPDNGWR